MNWLKTVIKNIFLNGFKSKKGFEDFSNTPNVENIYLNTEDNETIGAFLIKPSTVDSNTNYFVFCHGKGSDRIEATKLGKFCNYVKSNNMAFFVIDYRGFGDSSGEFNSECVNKDLNAAFQYLKTQYDLKNIDLIGHSMGTGVALQYCKYLKNKNIPQPRRVFLFAPFTSMASALREFKIYRFLETIFPFIHRLLPGDFEFDNLENITEFDGDLHLFHGKSDPLISPEHSNRIKEAFENSINFKKMTGRKKPTLNISEDGHDHVLSNPEHWKFIILETETQNIIQN